MVKTLRATADSCGHELHLKWFTAVYIGVLQFIISVQWECIDCWHDRTDTDE